MAAPQHLLALCNAWSGHRIFAQSGCHTSSKLPTRKFAITLVQDPPEPWKRPILYDDSRSVFRPNKPTSPNHVPPALSFYAVRDNSCVLPTAAHPLFGLWVPHLARSLQHNKIPKELFMRSCDSSSQPRYRMQQQCIHKPRLCPAPALKTHLYRIPNVGLSSWVIKRGAAG